MNSGEYGGSSSQETTPLLYPPIKPIFNYSGEEKKGFGESGEYEGEDDVVTVEMLKKAGIIGPKTNCKRYLGIMLALCASFLLSLTTLIAKVLIEYHPFNEAMWRFQGILLPSIPIMLWAKVVRKEDVFHTIHPIYQKDKMITFLVLFARAFCGCTAVIFQFYALNYIEIGDVTVISFTTPVFVSILAYFVLGEKLGVTPIAIALVTLLGIGVIARPPFLSGAQGFDPQNLIGVALAMGCMIFATFTYVALRWLRPVHYSVVTFFYGFYSVLECLIFALVAGVLQLPQGGEHWGLAIALGVIAFCGQSMFTLALKFEDAGPVALIRTSEVIFTFVWQIIFLGQVPDSFSVIGAFLILLSVLLTTFRKWIIEQPEKHPLRMKFSFLLK